LRKRVRPPDRSVDALLGRREDDLGAEPLEDEAPLFADAGGHAQAHAAALHRADHGDRDAGVARGGLEDDLPLRQLPALLGAGDHGESRAVLDRASRVAALELAEDADA